MALGTIFTPALANGEAVEFTTSLTINFDNTKKGGEAANASSADSTVSGNEGGGKNRFTVVETPWDTGD